MRLWLSELDLKIDSSRMPIRSIKACTEDKPLNLSPAYLLNLETRRRREKKPKVRQKERVKRVKAKKVKAKRRKRKIQNG